MEVMREILFRGKDIVSGEWLTGFLVSAKHIGDWIKANPVQPETVGQFSGVTDKNGKKIFEGDIIHYVYEPGEGYWNSNQNGVIKWREPGWYMEGIKGTNKYALMSGYLTTIPYASIGNEQKNIQVFEVIGNIHDNPELLEVE